MPALAGWLTGEQVSQEVIAQTLTTMGTVLSQHGGQPAQMVQPGVGLISFSDPAYAMEHNDDPPLLDWVPDRRTLVYRRPLSGANTLYYVEDWPAQGNLIFASEIKALLAVGVPRKLHLAALDALLRYGFIPAPWTAFKDIRVVPAGSILRWQHTKIIVNQSTDYQFDASPQKDLAEQLYALLDKAATNILPPHEQLAAVTGGGSYSALSINLAAHHTSTAFTIATLGNKKSLAAKLWKAAEQIAETCERPFLAITGVDQPDFWTATLAGVESPVCDTRALALHQLLHTVASETEARVVLSGLGGHILFGVPDLPLLKTPSESATQPDILHTYHQWMNPSNKKEPSLLWSKNISERLQQEEAWENTLHARKIVRKAAQFTDYRQGLYYLDLHLRLPDSHVHPTQQLAAQERMAIRSPYLTQPVIDLLSRTPLVLEDTMAKEQLLTLLTQRYMDREPSVGIPLTVPVTSLLRLEESELVKQILAPEAIRTTGIFEPQAVEHLLKQPQKKTNMREVVFVFTTQLFCQLFGVEL